MFDQSLKAVRSAFSEADRLAKRSEVVQFTEAPLELGDNNQYFNDLARVADVLRNALRAAGSSGAFVVEDLRGHERFPEELREDLTSLVSHCHDAGYIYGLAVGLALSRAGRA